MAADAGIGGIFVEKISLSSVTWIGALGVTIAIVATLALSRAQSSIYYNRAHFFSKECVFRHLKGHIVE